MNKKMYHSIDAILEDYSFDYPDSLIDVLRENAGRWVRYWKEQINDFVDEIKKELKENGFDSINHLQNFENRVDREARMDSFMTFFKLDSDGNKRED